MVSAVGVVSTFEPAGQRIQKKSRNGLEDVGSIPTLTSFLKEVQVLSKTKCLFKETSHLHF